MTFIAVVTLLFGILVAMGGAIGFVVSSSVASLIMGGTFGALIVIGALLMNFDKYYLIGFSLSLSLAIALASFFGYRYFHTFKMMPAGIFALISLIVACLLLASKWPQNI